MCEIQGSFQNILLMLTNFKLTLTLYKMKSIKLNLYQQYIIVKYQKGQHVYEYM